MMSPQANDNSIVKSEKNVQCSKMMMDPLQKRPRLIRNYKYHVREQRLRKNHVVATYEQIKRGLSCYYPKGMLESDGIHTQPLNL